MVGDHMGILGAVVFVLLPCFISLLTVTEDRFNCYLPRLQALSDITYLSSGPLHCYLPGSQTASNITYSES